VRDWKTHEPQCSGDTGSDARLVVLRGANLLCVLWFVEAWTASSSDYDRPLVSSSTHVHGMTGSDKG